MKNDPDEVFILDKMTRAEIASWLNYYHDRETTVEEPQYHLLQPDDNRLTNEFCQWFCDTLNKISYEDFGEEERNGTYEDLANEIWSHGVDIVDFDFYS